MIMMNVPRKKGGKLALLGASLCAMTGTAAYAQDAPPPPSPAVATDAGAASVTGTAGADGLVTYTPADFATLAPRSALDMVAQIPNFEISDSDDARGLGTASQNVLINGQRVSGKSSDAEAALAAIPAERVLRIEVSEGARLGIPGLTGRVANVVVTESASGRFTTRYRWEGQQRRNVRDQFTTASISTSGRVGGTDLTFSLSNDNGLRRGGVGLQRNFDAGGSLTGTSFERVAFHADRPRLAATLARRFDDGSILNLNLAGELYRFRFRSRNDVLAIPSGLRTDELLRTREDERSGEIGGDYEFALGGGRLKLIFLQSYEHSPTSSTAVFTPRTAGAVPTGSRFASTVDEGESILRAEYSWGDGAWQISGETAYNFLDSRIAFGRLQPDGNFGDVALPSPVTFVDEWRGEILLTRSLTLDTGLTLQLIGGGEVSRLRLTGPGGQTRQFFRPKGSATLAWSATPTLTITSTLARRVGQLSFFDFTDSVNLESNTSTAGNADLVPEQSWRAEVQAVQSLGTLGSVTVSAFGERITDIVDSIPIGLTGEGVGNLPSAWRAGVSGSATLLLDRWGAQGVRLEVNGNYRRSRVDDPVTGQPREISDNFLYNWNIGLRHDVPGSAVAWGVSAGRDRSAPSFRLDQTSEQYFSRPFGTLYIEHKDVFGATVRLTVRNLFDGGDRIRREVYVNRRDGPVAFREDLLRRVYPLAVLTVSGSF